MLKVANQIITYIVSSVLVYTNLLNFIAVVSEGVVSEGI